MVAHHGLDSVVSPDSNSNGKQCTSAGGAPRRAVDDVSSAGSRTGAQGAVARRIDAGRCHTKRRAEGT